MRRAGARVQARVVRHRLDTVARKELGGLLHRVAREAVDDARVAGVLLAQEAQQLLLGVGLRHDPVLDVGAVEAGHEVSRRRHVQPLGDLAVGGVGGRRREREPGHVRPAFAEQRQGEVVGPEVVAPLGDAVRLVDGEEGDLAAGEQIQGALQTQPLGRQVQQVQLPREELGLHHAPLVEVLRGVHEPGAHAERPQRVHLVLHQRDQRRDHDARAGPDQGRDLIAQGLSAAGRHEHDGVTAGHHVIDDRFLLTAERLVPEDPVQGGQRLAVPLPHLRRLCHLADHARPAHRLVPRTYCLARPVRPARPASTTASTIGVRTDSLGVIHRLHSSRRATSLFGRELSRGAVRGLDVLCRFSIDVDRQNRLEPDVIVLREEALTSLEQTRVPATEVVLAVEVTSPDSLSRERLWSGISSRRYRTTAVKPRSRERGVSARTPPPDPPGPGSTAAPHRAPP